METNIELPKSFWDKVKGYRTVAVGILIAVAPALVDYVGGLNVQELFGLSPTAGAAIGAIIVALRVITRGPIPMLDRHH